MARVIRLCVAAGLALAATAAWATNVKSAEKAAGGEAWYDEFYSASGAGPRPAVVPAASRGATSAAAPDKHSQKRASHGDQVGARGDHRRLARSR